MNLDGDIRRLGAYVRTLADRMGLQSHGFVVTEGPMTVEGHGAEVEVIFGQRRATITFREDWPSWRRKELRNTVVHELIHCHVNPALHGTIAMIDDHVSKVLHEAIWNTAEERLEIAVDGIATAWADALPLPEKGKKGKK